jgi:hypothetical protein
LDLANKLPFLACVIVHLDDSHVTGRARVVGVKIGEEAVFEITEAHAARILSQVELAPVADAELTVGVFGAGNDNAVFSNDDLVTAVFLTVDANAESSPRVFGRVYIPVAILGLVQFWFLLGTNVEPEGNVNMACEAGLLRRHSRFEADMIGAVLPSKRRDYATAKSTEVREHPPVRHIGNSILRGHLEIGIEVWRQAFAVVVLLRRLAPLRIQCCCIRGRHQITIPRGVWSLFASQLVGEAMWSYDRVYLRI